MKIVVLGNQARLEELLSNSSDNNLTTIRVETPQELLLHDDADAFFHLDFEKNTDRKEQPKQLSKPIFINSVTQALPGTDDSLIRINGWPTFLKRPILEASCKNETIKEAAEKIVAGLNKTIDWVPDIPGFVSARVVSMIINEAYFALQEEVSTKAEIDIAMKLGTNYPFGPFEWSEKIGLKNIYTLLVELSKTNSRYQPAALLEKEATQ